MDVPLYTLQGHVNQSLMEAVEGHLQKGEDLSVGSETR